MTLPIQALTETLADPWEHTATVADLVTVAQAAENTGHSFIGVCDHIAIPASLPHMSTTWYDTVATLAFLAAHTSTINLASLVWVAPYRHPLQTAKSFATLDHLSAGRAILGVGAGHVHGEFEALGVDYAGRGDTLDEIISAVRGVFGDNDDGNNGVNNDGNDDIGNDRHNGTDSYVGHHGKKFQYTQMGVGPTPSRELPIWVGGSGRNAWRRAGRLGDGYVPMGNPVSQYREIVDTIRQAAGDANRSDEPFDIGYMVPWAYLLANSAKTAPKEIPDHLIFGPEAVAETICQALDAGANTMHLKFRSRSKDELLDQLTAFTEQVAPSINN